MIIKSKNLLVLGILMMLSMVGCTENVDFSEETVNSPEATNGDTVANTAMAKIVAYATDSTNNSAPTVADYVVAGVTGVDIANLNAVNVGVAAAGVAGVDVANLNTGVAATDAAGVDTVAKIQIIADAGIAMAKIMAYATATDGSKSAPTVDDYVATGITSVDAANLSAVNAGVVAASANTVAKIRAIAIAMVKITAYATNSSKPTVDDYKVVGVENVDAANLSAVNAGVAKTDAAGCIPVIIENA